MSQTTKFIDNSVLNAHPFTAPYTCKTVVGRDWSYIHVLYAGHKRQTRYSPSVENAVFLYLQICYVERNGHVSITPQFNLGCIDRQVEHSIKLSVLCQLQFSELHTIYTMRQKFSNIFQFNLFSCSNM